MKTYKIITCIFLFISMFTQACQKDDETQGNPTPVPPEEEVPSVFSGTIGYCSPFISLEIPSHKRSKLFYNSGEWKGHELFSHHNNRHGISTSVLSIIPYRNLFTPCFSIIRRTFGKMGLVCYRSVPWYSDSKGNT